MVYLNKPHISGAVSNTARARELLVQDPDVLNVTITGKGDDLAHIHAQPLQSMAALLAVFDQYDLVLETPLEQVGDGVRLTIVADETTLQQALADLPDDVRLELKRTGPYRPTRQHLSSLLTDRQRENLTIAIQEGYYDIPRASTLDEVAAISGLSTATVCEHLRKVESRVFSHLVE